MKILDVDEDIKIPFDLVAFQNGTPAIDIKRNLVVKFRLMVNETLVNYEFEDLLVGESYIDDMKTNFVMMSKHIELKNQFIVGNSYLQKHNGTEEWIPYYNIRTRAFFKEDCEYKLHPHNEQIKKYIDGSIKKWECLNDGVWESVETPTWDLDCLYRPFQEYIELFEYIAKNNSNVIQRIYMKDGDTNLKDWTIIHRTGQKIIVPNF